MEARNPWGVFVALLFGTFVTIEAAAFQAPALPSVTRHFGIPVNLAALILVLYFLALTVFAPIMGRFGDQHGRKKVLTGGLLIFALSEFAAAWAPNFPTFLTARFAQGFGVACILPGVFAYVTHLFPEQRRGTALGVLTFTMTFGAASGGLLGGLLIDRLGWPSVYWISGALALVGLLTVRLLVPEIRAKRMDGTFDYPGAMLLFAAIASLLSLPTWAGNFGARSPITWAIAVTGCTSLVMLWRRSGRTATPVVDATILSRMAFALPSAIYWLHMLFFSGIVYSLAFFINNRPGGTAAQFGFVTLFLYGSGLLSAPLAGRLIDRFEPRTVSIIALAGSLAGALMFVGIRVDTSLWMVIAVTCVLGFSMGANTPAIMKMAFSAIPPQKMGAGTGLFSMFRDLGSPTGSSFSLAVFGATLAYQTSASLQHRGASAGLDPETIDALTRFAGSRAQTLPEELSARVSAHAVEAQSLVDHARLDGLGTALTNVGYLLTVLIGFALLLAICLRRQLSGPAQESTSRR